MKIMVKAWADFATGREPYDQAEFSDVVNSHQGFARAVQAEVARAASQNVA